MNRREFIAGLSGAAVWPAVAQARQAHPVIGFLGINSPEGLANVVAGFHKGLSETGFVEDRNVLIEFRWAGGQFDRMPALIADLVRDRVAVIFASAPSAVRAAQAQTMTIPIVFHMGEDPVKEGVVASLNRPGANVTGVSDFANQLAGKRLSLLRDMVPKVYALLVKSSHPSAESDTADARAAAQALGLDLRVLTADNEIDVGFATMTQPRAGALLVNIDPFFTERREQLVALAARYAIPAIFALREFAPAGGLMSYGADRTESSRQAGIYVGRILKGEKPADLPVQQATKFELVINAKTAKALGVEVPETLLATADEVIQ
jgi:putative tryptophan/tyrosine transport system substrate-binding protein